MQCPISVFLLANFDEILDFLLGRRALMRPRGSFCSISSLLMLDELASYQFQFKACACITSMNVVKTCKGVTPSITNF